MVHQPTCSLAWSRNEVHWGAPDYATSSRQAHGQYHPKRSKCRSLDQTSTALREAYCERRLSKVAYLALNPYPWEALAIGWMHHWASEPQTSSVCSTLPLYREAQSVALHFSSSAFSCHRLPLQSFHRKCLTWGHLIQPSLAHFPPLSYACFWVVSGGGHSLYRPHRNVIWSTVVRAYISRAQAVLLAF